jgi:hypothetical protein
MDPGTSRLYSRRVLHDAGYGDDELRRMRRRGELTLLRRGAYLAGPEITDPDQRRCVEAKAALAALADGAVASHVSAAALHGLPTWGMPASRAHVTRDRRSGGRRGRAVHVHVSPLRPEEIVSVGGLPVTSVARTVVDLARTVPFEAAVVAADAALARRLVSSADLALMLVRCIGWRGSPAARRAIGFADGRGESVGETRSRMAIARAGLPAPVPQWEVTDESGGLIGRVDFGWPAAGVVGEFDGRVKYGRLVGPGSTPGDVVFREKRREDALRAAGMAVVRWTWEELTNFDPTAARLRRALASR